MKFPENLKYTKDHEWIRIDGNAGTVGITDFAQDQLGDVVFVELPKVGTRLTRGQTFGVVESVKTVSDLFSPVAGTVTEVNPLLEKNPEKINHDPYDAGWIMKIALDTPSSLTDLLDAKAYSATLADH